MLNTYITDFQSYFPRFKAEQETNGLSWLAKAHAKVLISEKSTILEKEKKFEILLKKFGCSKDIIENRYTEIYDFFLTNWEDMKIYNLEKFECGASLEQRMQVYRDCVLDALRALYPSENSFPKDIIHVSCTGYYSPSAVQEFIQEKSFSYETRLIHLYHMGCYAALPATYLADCIVKNVDTINKNRCDIFHSELCTLHFNPHLHSPEQLVIQSLFSDGYIRYSILKEESHDDVKIKKNKKDGFLILTHHETLIPNSSSLMAWVVSNNAFCMSLSRDMPKYISDNIYEFCKKIIEKSKQNNSFDKLKSSIIFAIHPGGPKIIDNVCSALGIDKNQARQSSEVLKKRGNMSSATLPHVWKKILEDGQVETGTLVLSLAFGPGVTISGSLFCKV